MEQLSLDLREETVAQVNRTRNHIETKGVPDAVFAEQLVVASVLRGDAKPEDTGLDASDFALDKHRKLWVVMLDLSQRGVEPNTVNIMQEMIDRKMVEKSMAFSEMLDYTMDIPQIYNLESYVEKVKEAALKVRYISRVLRSIDSLLLGSDLDEVQEEITVASKPIESIHKPHYMRTCSDIVGRHVETFIETQKPGIMSGIDALDEMTYGFQRKELTIIGARPSDGKTTLMTQIAAHAAINEGLRVQILSLEMSSEQLMKRILCQCAGVSFHHLRMGQVEEYEKDNIVKLYHQCFAKNPLGIDDNVDWTINKISNHLKAQKASGEPVDLLCIDYLGLMPLGNGGSMQDRHDLKIGQITRGLKLLAKEFNLAVILLSQLSRDGEKENRKPRKSDLKDSGNIEADADMIIMPWHDKKKEDHNGRPAELILEKQRNGPTGPAYVYFDKKSTTFMKALQRAA